MPKKAPVLAKLSRPRLHKAVARERLFALLDEARGNKPAICVVGPPGAGKTTLVASWLDARTIKGIWFQVDPGDADLATFFYYLGEAARAFSRKGQRPLPVLTQEFLQDLEGFSRRFFRELLSRLPDGAALVLDNYQDVAPEQTFHRLIAQAVEEVPPTATLIAVSRRDPPDCYSRLMANDNVARVDWDELKLTLEETSDIARARGKSARVDFETLHQLAGGWAAGLVLMLEQMHFDSLRSEEEMAAAPRDALFGYFAAIVFNQVSEDVRRFLIYTSHLSQITAVTASVLTGDPSAPSILDRLYRHRLFVHRRAGDPPSYQYHALFREFLQSQASQCLGHDELRHVKSQTADLLMESEPDAAFRLYVEIGSWQKAASIITSQARKLVGQGRWQTLLEWIEALPPDNIRCNPVIKYWRGSSTILVNPAKARPILEEAYQDFHAQRDSLWQLLCASAILEAICYEFSDFSAIDEWLQRIGPLLAEKLVLLAAEDELRLHASILMGATIRVPDHPLLTASVARVEELLMQPLDVNLRLGAATMLHFYSHLVVDPVAEQIADQFAVPLIQLSEAAPIRVARYLTVAGYTHYMHGRYGQAVPILEQAVAITEKHRLDHVMLNSLTFLALCQCRAQLLEDAERTIQRLEKVSRPFRELRIAPESLVRAVLADKQGQREKAKAYVIDTLSRPRRPGMYVAELHLRIICSNILVASGDYDRAADLIDQTYTSIQGSATKHFTAIVFMNLAWLCHGRGSFSDRNAFLSKALQHAKDHKSRLRLIWYPNALSELLPIALNESIEPSIAYDIAREFGVRPVHSRIEQWPWPVKIYTLGSFRVDLHDKPLSFPRKTPRRLIALLKALVAFGGEGIPDLKLIDALWPDEEGDAALHALSAAVHRLRRLLGETRALVVDDGTVSLNREFVWIDVLESVNAFVAAESALGRGDEAAFTHAVRVLRNLYKGPFLPLDAEEPWSVSMREQLKARFVQIVIDYGAQLELAERWDEAADWYRRGVTADDLTETFYQGLMRCHIKTGRCAEGLSVFRRMKQVLSVTLGVHPSPQSEVLHRSLQGF